MKELDNKLTKTRFRCLQQTVDELIKVNGDENRKLLLAQEIDTLLTANESWIKTDVV